MERYFVLLLFVIFQVEALNECLSNPCRQGSTCQEANEAYLCLCQYGYMGTNCDQVIVGITHGTNHYTPTGVISSQNYPSNYPDRGVSVYLIRVSKAQRIIFTISAFNTEYQKDYFEYGAGGVADYNVAIAQYSGDTAVPSEAPFTLPFTYTIFDDSAWIIFSSDFNNPRTGWSLTYEADLDDCLSNPCLNGGICIDREFGYICLCLDGYTGNQCQTNINECVSYPCHNYAVCQDGVNQFICNCVPGWTGVLCEIDVNECSSNPCQNNALCTNRQNQYTCTCTPGWVGTNCETDICASNPCQNNALCNNEQNQYSCTCMPGWEGTNCDIDINECVSNPCLNATLCEDLENSYKCVCPVWNGTHCIEDINECSSQPCLNGGTCNNYINLYTCDCLAGWGGDNCGIENSGEDVIIYLMVVLGVIILLSIVFCYIFYKYKLKNKHKGHDPRAPVVVYAVPNELVAKISTSTYDNQLSVAEVNNPVGPQLDNDGYVIFHPPPYSN